MSFQLKIGKAKTASNPKMTEIKGNYRLCVWLEHTLAWNTIELAQMVNNKSERNYKLFHLAQGQIDVSCKTKAKTKALFGLYMHTYKLPYLPWFGTLKRSAWCKKRTTAKLTAHRLSK